VRKQLESIDADLEEAQQDIKKAQEKVDEMIEEYQGDRELHKLVHDLDED